MGDVLPLPFNGSTARIALSPEITERVEAILEDEQFDVVHVHEPEAPLLNWAVRHAPSLSIYRMKGMRR